MGKTPDQLEREIAAHRDRMSDKMRGLDQRVRSDVQNAKSALQDDVKERTHLNEYVEKRPLTTMLGAFGTGLLLGMAPNGGSNGHGTSNQQPPRSSSPPAAACSAGCSAARQVSSAGLSRTRSAT